MEKATANLKSGDIVRCQKTRRRFRMLGTRDDGVVDLVNLDGDTTYTCNSQKFLSLVERSLPGDDYYLDKADDAYKQLASHFLKLPFRLFKVLDLDEIAFLCYLEEWKRRKTTAEILLKSDGWFYCPDTCMDRELCQSAKVRRRLFKQLERKGFVETKMQYGSKSYVKKGEARFKNHRLIHLRWDRILLVLGPEDDTYKKAYQVDDIDWDG